jgi:glycosyltransferase involved in cell wall biosynthesis
MGSTKVSVIIPTYNDGDRLAQCLAALENQDYAGEYEILVVDNGSDVLPTITGRARLLHEEEPGSYNARNRGLKEAKGAVLAFTDADCRPHPGWLSAGVAAGTASPDIGLVGGRVIVTSMPGQRPTLAELFETAIAFPQETYVKQGKYAATANMFTTRAVMNKVGVFNGQLRSGGDADWGQRVAAAGYQLVYAADAAIEHPARASHREITAKLRRTVGGERDRHPGWAPAMRFTARHVMPPRSRIRCALRLEGISLLDRALVAGYCIVVNLYQAAYRLQLQLSGAGSPR